MFDFPYLTVSLLLFGLAITGLILFPRQRHLALASGLLQAPFGLLSIFFVPTYWQPVRIAELIAGPEDLLFSFSNGVLIWLFACGHINEGTTLRSPWRTIFFRYTLSIVLAVSLGLLLMHFDMEVMSSMLIACVLVGTISWYFCRNRDSLRVGRMVLRGSTRFGFFHLLVVVGTLTFWPEMWLQWNHDNFWNQFVVPKVPLGEITWAMVTGAVWPIFAAFVLGVGSLPLDEK